VTRRQFITLLGGATAAWPLAARAQQGDRVRRVGVLSGYAEDDVEAQSRLSAFREGLEKLGWSEGGNVRVDARFAGGESRLTREYAAELVAALPDVILCSGTPVTMALQQATRTIPIVFVLLADPVGTGLVGWRVGPSLAAGQPICTFKIERRV
jgi:putative ABC transport system substrate-binding protein